MAVEKSQVVAAAQRAHPPSRCLRALPAAAQAGDQSEWVGLLRRALLDVGSRLGEAMPPNYFRFFCDKLLASFGFLERHEPALARPRGEPRAPPFEVIEVLSRAEAAGRLSETGWQELREEVLEQSPTPAAVHRRLTERFGPPAAPPTPPKAERLARLAAAARRLAEGCRAERSVPPGVAERAGALAEALEELADERP